MKKLQKKHRVLISLNIVLWTLNILSLNGNLKLSAQLRSGVELVSEPERVKVSIDGTPFSNGSYLTTPIFLPLSIGQHKITVQRAGYHSNISSVIMTTNERLQKMNTVLEPATENLHQLSIETPDADSTSHIDLSVSGGLEVGKIPLNVTDLISGIHILEISSKSWTKQPVRCQFEIPITKPDDVPYTIKIENQGKKLRIHGCKKL